MRLFPESSKTLQLTVGQFAERLRKVFEERIPAFQRIAIEGEISQWKTVTNGNAYFTLKDAHATLHCFAFAAEARRFPPVGDGTAVVATGSVSIRANRSEYQLRVLELAPFGVGVLAAKVEALRKRLQAEGVFDDARKRRVPRFPRRVALVSARGKGAEDFETTMREKASNVIVTFVETRVEGEGAEIEIADAIDRAGRAGVDAIVVARGGGSYEALYPFNCEPVVRAIVRSRLPVLTAIGHTGDRHLADEAADEVFKTPTAAAEFIAANWLDVINRLASLGDRLERAIGSAFLRAAQRGDAASNALQNAVVRRLSASRQRSLSSTVAIERQNPRDRVAARRLRLQGAGEALRAAMLRALPQWERRSDAAAQRLQGARERSFFARTSALALATGRLVSADPQKPLERGYAIVTLGGRALRDAADAPVGAQIEAKLYRGSLRARVEGVADDD